MDTFTPAFELSKSSFNPFNFDSFRKFIVQKKVFTTAIAIVIGDQIKQMTDSVFRTFLDPIIEPDFDGDGKKDLNFITKYTLHIFGLKFTIGKLLVDFVKFLFVIWITFMVSRFTMDIVD